jgi:MFS family permease
MAALVVLAGTSSSAALGLGSVLVCMMAGSIAFGLPGSALADRLGAGRALVAGVAARGVFIVAALLLPADPIVLGFIAFGYSAASKVFCPAELALVSALGAARPARAHALLVALQHTGYVLGAIVAAPLLYFAGGVTAIIGGAVVLYVVVGAVSLFIAANTVHVPSVAATDHAFNFRRTVAYYARKPVAGHAALTLAFAEVSSKALAISLPAYLLHDLGLNAPAHYLLAVPAGAGALIGLYWASRYFQLRDANDILRLALLGTVVSMVALACLGTAFSQIAEFTDRHILFATATSQRLSVAVAVPVALLLGGCYAVTPIAARGVLSATAPAGQQARVFGVQATFTDLLCIGPLLLSGFSTEVAGPRITFLLVGILGAAVFLLLEFVRYSRKDHASEPIAAQPAAITLANDA